MEKVKAVMLHLGLPQIGRSGVQISKIWRAASSDESVRRKLEAFLRERGWMRSSELSGLELAQHCPHVVRLDLIGAPYSSLLSKISGLRRSGGISAKKFLAARSHFQCSKAACRSG